MKTETKLTMFIKYFTFVLISILITSCATKPDILEFEQEIKDQIELESNGNISLSSIEKTNSEEKEFLGQKAYSIYYKAAILFNTDCWIYTNRSGYGAKFESFKTYSEQPEFFPSPARVASSAKKGQIANFNGMVTYFETENGWVRK